MFDSVIVSQEPWATLVPRTPKDGPTYRVPEATVRELARAGSSDLSSMLRPGDLTAAQLTSTVRAAGAG